MKSHMAIKASSLLFLVVQNTVLVLLMKSSFSAKGPMYIPSTVIVLVEALKLVICLLVVAFQFAHEEFLVPGAPIASPQPDLVQVLKMEVFTLDAWRLSLPAALYAAQNNLLYFALGRLDTITFQITHQLKILTTALFSVLLLKKRLGLLKWASLCCLVCGIVLVQLEPSSGGNERGDHGLAEQQLPHMCPPYSSRSFPWMGLSAITLAAITSGFSSIYFELLVKSRNALSANLWIRNIQLGMFGLFFSLLAMVFNDWDRVSSAGFFQGYHLITWLIVGLQAVGGLAVSLVVKYADSIVKGFATAVSLVVSNLVVFYCKQSRTEPLVLAGCSLVLISLYIYSLPEHRGFWPSPKPLHTKGISVL